MVKGKKTAEGSFLRDESEPDPEKQKYSHAFCVAFTIINDIEDGHFTPYRDKLTAMAKRLTVLLEQEEPEAFDCYDSFEVNE